MTSSFEHHKNQLIKDLNFLWENSDDYELEYTPYHEILYCKRDPSGIPDIPHRVEVHRDGVIFVRKRNPSDSGPGCFRWNGDVYKNGSINDAVLVIFYYDEDGSYHREDGPAKIVFKQDGTIDSVEFYWHHKSIERADLFSKVSSENRKALIQNWL